MFLRLALSFLKIGLLSFGGGYGMIPLIQHEIEQFGIGGKEFVDILAVSQITPGPIGINTATYTGYKAAGFAGSCAATFFVCLPGFFLMMAVTRFFYTFRTHPRMERFFAAIRPVFIGLIAASVLLMAGEVHILTDPREALVFAAVFCASYFFRVSPIPLTVAAAVAGLVLF